MPAAEQFVHHETEVSLGEKCGIIAVYSPDMAAPILATMALDAIQHRGQDSAGIATIDDFGLPRHETGMGRVLDVLNDEKLLDIGGSEFAIAQNRYATEGKISDENAQPFVIADGNEVLELAHNGEITNKRHLEGLLHNPPPGSSDTAVLSQFLFEQHRPDEEWAETLQRALPEVDGSYCLTMLTKQGLFAARDPKGIRPLYEGLLENGGVAFASETKALDMVGGSFQREVKRGEIVQVTPDGKKTSYDFSPEDSPSAFCSFETIYFMKPESKYNEKMIAEARQEMGRSAGERMKQKGIRADSIVPVLNSGLHAGIGVSQALGIDLVEAIKIRPDYTRGRTYITAEGQREDAALSKYDFVKVLINGKELIVPDDSIVRGTTMPKIANRLYENGAKKIHIVATCPPVINKCYWGTDMDGNLVARPWKGESIDVIEQEVARAFGVASVTYTPIESIAAAVGKTKDEMCYYCFGGPAPTSFVEKLIPIESIQTRGTIFNYSNQTIEV